MKITREADYALRIVAMLSGEKVQIEAKQISEKKAIPYRFTLKILRKLVKSGIVKSFRGVNGGYALNKEPSEITVKSIIEVIDGPIAVNKCIENHNACANSKTCQLRKYLLLGQTAFENELEKVNFEMVLSSSI
ncbi:MAG: Rrf2 family transcriptional regulator [Clostridia bacterium]|nr:Rrf2 family transcriptional regulator [Clostridia bacterium]